MLPSDAEHVLVVDDEASIRILVHAILSREGYRVLDASDPWEALGVAETHPIGLLLTDVAMPRMNGYDTARRMRQESWGGQVMLVAMTGWGRDIDKRRSQEAGFDEHLVKPIEMDALEMILKKSQAASVRTA